MRLFLLAVLLFLGGCFPNTNTVVGEPYYSSSGKLARTVSCAQSATLFLSRSPNLSVCRKQAGSICKRRGYKVLSVNKPAGARHILMAFECK